jgi:hypothetical protein
MPHYVDKALEGLRELGAEVKKIGIEKIAEKSGVRPSIVKKFTIDPMVSKNADIRKIRAAVEAFKGEQS